MSEPEGKPRPVEQRPLRTNGGRSVTARWRWVAAAVAVWGAVVGGGPLLLGAPGGDDAYYHAMYAVEHARCWRGGVLWPTWYPDLLEGLGAPEPRARPALPLALHAAFALALDDAVAATSLATVLIPLAAGLVGFTVARRRDLSPLECGLAGAVWAAAPYLVVSLHQRAALQEAWAVAALPLVLDVLLPPRPAGTREVVAAAGAFAVLAATQLLDASMVAVVVAVAHLVSPARRIVPAATAGALGLAFAAASWVPNLFALWRVQSSGFTTAWFDWRRRLLLTSGTTDPELTSAMTWTLFGVAGAAAVIFLSGRSRRGGAVAVVAVAALATPAAAPLYAGIPGFALLQFPWRWLAVASALALLACLRSGQAWRGWALALLVLPVVAIDPVGWRLAPGPPLAPTADRATITRAATRYGVPPVLPPFPAMVPRGVDLRLALEAGRTARGALPPARPDGPRSWRWELAAASGDETVLPLLAAAGWRTSVDGREVGWRQRSGLVAVPGGSGVRRVEARQVALPEDLAGGVVSLAAVVALALRRLRHRAGRRG